MRLEVLHDHVWADHVAGLLADRLAERPDLVVCLPTGSTPLPVYERLPAVLAGRGLTAARATFVVLDEYLGLPPGHVARCDAVLRRTLVDRLEPPPRLVTFEVDGSRVDDACARYDEAIAAAGGLGLVVLGLGRNGHLGMNEPGTDADAPTRMVELTASTRAAAVDYGADPPPTHGVTLGLAGIRAAAEAWLLATGALKASILARTLHGPATADVPGTSLRDHPRVSVIVDRAAAGEARGS